jgi:hypothetical protein
VPVATEVMALVPLPRRTALVSKVVEPVPPLATVKAVPFHVPEVIVPTVARLARVVTRGIEVVEISTFPLFKAVKLSFIVVRLSFKVSVEAIVVTVVPRVGSDWSIRERGMKLYAP